jgi:adenylate cyclase
VPDSFFRDKIVIIGDTTSDAKDHHPTPVSDNMDGVEIHAHAIATLLQHRFVLEAIPLTNIVMICLLPGIVCILAIAGGLYRIALGTVLVVVGYFLVNVWLFNEYGVWMHLIAPIAAAIACAACMFWERSQTDDLDKRRMRWLLRRYISPELAEHIIANPEACVPGGKSVTATVLFADIRGFARMSEDRSPEEIVSVLNTYFDSMTTVAFKYGGIVDKFVGDAVMVLFGVPIPYEDHACRAVSAAIEMQSVLLDLQRKWLTDGLPTIDIRIGINTGTMVAGSIGSIQRLEYTVIGDDVNTASRVTDLNKQMQTRILATQATYEMVMDMVEARGPLSGEVKGKKLIAYEIIGWKEDIPVAKV